VTEDAAKAADGIRCGALLEGSMERLHGVTPSADDQSTNLVRIAGVFYGVAVGGALTRRPEVVLHPLDADRRVAALAMVVVFIASAWAFLGYSLNMQRFPYRVGWGTGSGDRTGFEELRFVIDLLVALGYGALLLIASEMDSGRSSLAKFFSVLCAVYLLDVVSDVLRGRRWEVKVFKSVVGALGVAVPFVLRVGYALLGVVGIHRTDKTNVAFLLVALVAIEARELINRRDAHRAFAAATTAESARAAAHGPRPVYLAGPLGFSAPGREYHQKVLKPAILAAGYTALDPWENTTDPVRPQVDQNDQLGAMNADMIRNAAAVFAVLDGPDVDSGTAAEIGYAAALGVPVVGLRTDTRQTGDNAAATVNLQVEWMIKASRGSVVLDDLAKAVSALSDVLD
jgi:nucleoside 2-deoxyribosyltransferase